MTDMLNGLNVDQLNAVTTPATHCLVLAGAGAGKTGVLTRRIAWLCSERGVSPSNVLALTFTRKAAREMRERLEILLGEKEARHLTVGTFHAVSLRILESYGSRLGYSKNINVYDEMDREDVVNAAIDNMGLAGVIKPKAVIAEMAGYASDCDTFEFQAETQAVVQEYRQMLKANNAVDFTMLLTETLTLLRKDPEVHRWLSDRYRWVFVDEYQDVDRTQFYLHEAIAPRNLFVVGDSDQAVYKWRGSDVKIVLDFEKFHKGAEVVKLERSYRCPGSVIEAANNLIQHNTERIEKTLWTANEAGTAAIHRVENEPGFVSQILQQWMAAGPETRKWSDIAVLTRTHAQHQDIAREFQEQLIPARMVGAHMYFWKQEETRMIVSLLKFLNNRKDTWHFRRVVKGPVCGMSDANWMTLEAEALRKRTRVVDELLSMFAGFKLKQLLEWHEADRSRPVAEVVAQILSDEAGLDIQGWFLRAHRSTRAERILEAIGEAHSWQESQDDGSVDTAAFLEWLAAEDVQEEVAEQGEEGKGEVSIATIHAVKGLEFKYVVLAGACEGLLPHRRSIKDPADIEEERRLCYVAITRAGEELHVIVPAGASNGFKFAKLEPSRFVAEMMREAVTTAASPPVPNFEGI